MKINLHLSNPPPRSNERKSQKNRPNLGFFLKKSQKFQISQKNIKFSTKKIQNSSQKPIQPRLSPTRPRRRSWPRLRRADPKKQNVSKHGEGTTVNLCKVNQTSQNGRNLHM